MESFVFFFEKEDNSLASTSVNAFSGSSSWFFFLRDLMVEGIMVTLRVVRAVMTL